jgi:hypothetical protein
MHTLKAYFVHIMTNRSKTLYMGTGSCFAAKYILTVILRGDRGRQGPVQPVGSA